MNLPARLDRLDRRSSRIERPTIDGPHHLQDAGDVLALVETAVHLAQADVTATPLEQARTLGALAGIALKALAARDLEARVEALERVLKLRKERR